MPVSGLRLKHSGLSHQERFTKEQKKQFISKPTVVSIEGENMRQVTWCIVKEVERGDWGITGNPLTAADVRSFARGKAAWHVT